MNPYDKYFTKEDNLHIACCNYLDSQYPNVLYTHPANEAKRTSFERYKANRLRMKPGVPDLLIFEQDSPFIGLAVELKIGKNKLSDYQKDWKEKLLKRNWYYFTCYDIDTFISLCKDYLGDRK
jgi:hypothetical protein